MARSLVDLGKEYGNLNAEALAWGKIEGERIRQNYTETCLRILEAYPKARGGRRGRLENDMRGAIRCLVTRVWGISQDYQEAREVVYLAKVNSFLREEEMGDL